jgi:hypothetical protein
VVDDDVDDDVRVEVDISFVLVDVTSTLVVLSIIAVVEYPIQVPFIHEVQLKSAHFKATV